MSSQGSNDDCYFYFYSSCTKGDDCPFRHCGAALGTETVCSLWREGRCFRDNCKFRHMESRINRATIPCYWESQPSGCLKPHCVFLHCKPKLNIHANSGNDGLILPVSTTVSHVSSSANVTDVKDTVKHIALNPVVESYSSNIGSDDLSPISHPVEPIVVSFDGEESDSESASSTPMKSMSYDSKCNSVSARKNLTDSFAEKDDFGIKTLEQIKMEKIHKESDNFYKSDDTAGAVIPDKTLGVMRNSTFLSDIFSSPAYDAPVIGSAQLKIKECYPPQSDFIMLSDRPIEKSMCANTDSSQHLPENERNFKSRTLKRKTVSLYSEASFLPKKMVCLKKSSKDDPLDFKIKTLDEIRREKQNKLGNNEETSAQPKNSQDMSSLDNSTKEASSVLNNKTESSNLNGKSIRRLKIKRQSKELLSDSGILHEADSSTENQKEDNRTQMILHEVQNIAEDQNKAEIKGKRKEIDGTSDSKSVKQFKSDCASPSNTVVPCTPNDLQNNSVSKEKQMTKLTRPVLKRKSTMISPPSKATSESEVSSSTISKNCESVILPKENGKSLEEKSTSSDKDADKKTVRASVDELDNFLLTEADMTLDYEPDGTLNESEDILLEIEQLLDS